MAQRIVHTQHSSDTEHEARTIHDLVAPHLLPGLHASPVVQAEDGTWGFVVSGTVEVMTPIAEE